MPYSCRVCPFEDYDIERGTFICTAGKADVDEANRSDERHRDCPLIQVYNLKEIPTAWPKGSTSVRVHPIEYEEIRSCETCRFYELRERYEREPHNKLEPYCTLNCRWIGNLRVCGEWMEKEDHNGTRND